MRQFKIQNTETNETKEFKNVAQLVSYFALDISRPPKDRAIAYLNKLEKYGQWIEIVENQETETKTETRQEKKKETAINLTAVL